MKGKRRLVVIGAVAAGTSAAAKAKRANPDLEVLLLERDVHISYGACGLPYFLAGLIPNVQALVARSPEEFRQQGVEVRIQHQVLEIDATNRRLRVADLQNSEEYGLPYDDLVVATGAVSFVPPVHGVELPGVFTLRTLADGLKLDGVLRDQRPKKTRSLWVVATSDWRWPRPSAPAAWP